MWLAAIILYVSWRGRTRERYRLTCEARALDFRPGWIHPYRKEHVGIFVKGEKSLTYLPLINTQTELRTSTIRITEATQTFVGLACLVFHIMLPFTLISHTVGACDLPSGYSDLAGADLFNCPSNGAHYSSVSWLLSRLTQEARSSLSDECYCDKGADVETVRTEFWRVCGLLEGVPMG